MDIKSLKDIHLNKKAFFVGNGPSLRMKDLDFLTNEISFGCNKIYLSFKETSWRPTYYSITDRVSAQTNASIISNIPSTKIFGEPVREALGEHSSANDIVWVNHISRPKDKDNNYIVKFSKDAGKHTFGGHTVLFFQLQIAFYMGIKEVILLGVDFNYKKSKATGEIYPNGEVLIGEGEVNHFHKDYRPAGERWIKPEKDIQQESFSLAYNNFIEDGRKFVNASRESELQAIPRVHFDSIKPS